MRKQILSGLVVLLLTGCQTTEWKRACNDVEIPTQSSCYKYSKTWSKRANELGYNTRSVTFFKKEDKMMPHAIVELTQKDGKVVYIEPQINWKIKIFTDEQIFPTNYKNGLSSTNNYEKMPVRNINFQTLSIK